MPRFWWTVIEYRCPKNHSNSINKFYRGETLEQVRARIPAGIACGSCGAMMSLTQESPSRITLRIIEIDEAQIKTGGFKLEPDIQ